MAELTRAQRIFFGYLNNSNIATITEGLMVFHYINDLGVSADFIAISNIIVACIASYSAVVVGNLSDRAKGKYRRKTYILISGPIFAVAQLLRFSSIVTGSGAGIYYLVTYAIQQSAFQAFGVAIDAWGQELTTDPVERGKLYAMSGIVGLATVVVSLGLLLVPFEAAGVIGLLSVLTAIALALFHLPEGTSLEKRVFMPTVTNLSSVLWNKQFRIFLVVSFLIFFFNTLPTLLPFFLQFPLGLSERSANTFYILCVGVFLLFGAISFLLIPRGLKRWGVLEVGRKSMLIVMLLAYSMLGFSYLSPIAVVFAFGVLGFVLSAANVAFGTISAECVDYDELLCGKKRASSYQAFVKPVNTFVSIAGSSIPLALMGAAGFQPAEDDEEDAESTKAANLIIRLWCTAFIGTLLLVAYLILERFKIDSTTHANIMNAIREREEGIVAVEPAVEPKSEKILGDLLEDIIRLGHDALEDSVVAKWDRNTGVAGAARMKAMDDNKASYPGLRPNEDEIPSGLNESLTDYAYQEASDLSHMVKRPLSSVTDPVTGLAVLPPPYAQVMEVIDTLSVNTDGKSFPEPLSESELVQLRLLGYYFPRRLHLCASDEGREAILGIGKARSGLALALCAISLWQTIRMLIEDNVFGSFLMLFVLLGNVVFLTYQALFYKGWQALSDSKERTSLLSAVKCVAEILQANERTRFSSELSTVVKSPLREGNNSIIAHTPELRPLLFAASAWDLVNNNAMFCIGMMIATGCSVVVVNVL